MLVVHRISNLPDSILAHILSFLPRTSNAVSTSILSRRWKSLWTIVPNFGFYDHFEYCDCRFCKGQQRGRSFEQFVSRVLLLSTVQSINKFVLSCGCECEPLCIKTWISTAIIRNVRELVVVSHYFLNELPSCLFTCGTLEILELMHLLEVNAPNLVCLPRLKCLKLVKVQYRNDGSVYKLISGCPVLELLDIDTDCPDNITIFRISSSSLKQLYFHSALYFPEDQTYKVEIDTPALEFLDFVNCMRPGNDVTLGSITSLVRAKIDVAVESGDGPVESDFYNPVVNLVKARHHVKFLTLSQDTVKALSHATASLSATRFERITKLVVKAFYCEWTCLQDLLEVVVNLEFLVFKMVVNDDDGFEPCWRNPKKVPRCLIMSLKEISFRGFNGFEDELAMIGYILKHGRVLNIVEIHSADYDIDVIVP